jgi:hypothetical protein
MDSSCRHPHGSDTKECSLLNCNALLLRQSRMFVQNVGFSPSCMAVQLRRLVLVNSYVVCKFVHLFMTWVTSYSRELLRFKVFIAVKIHIILFWAMKPCGLVSIHLEDYSVCTLSGRLHHIHWYVRKPVCRTVSFLSFQHVPCFGETDNVLMAVNIKMAVFWKVTTCSVL